MERSRKIVALLIIFVFSLVIAGCSVVLTKTAPINDPGLGVLVLAHGGNPAWNQEVTRAVLEIPGTFQRELALGMADAEEIQKGINNLEAKGVKKIVVVPLFLSSHSELYRQLEYTLGRREEPDALFWTLMQNKEPGHGVHGGNGSHLGRAKFSVPYTVASAINYHPFITSILAQRIQGLLSQNRLAAENQSVILLAHGPISEDDNKQWMLDLNIYADRLSKYFRGIRILPLTIRDDAPPFIRNRALQKIKMAIKQNGAAGRDVTIIPYLLAPDRAEVWQKELLEFTPPCGCQMILGALLPHKNISLWMERQIRKGNMSLTH